MTEEATLTPMISQPKSGITLTLTQLSQSSQMMRPR